MNTGGLILKDINMKKIVCSVVLLTGMSLSIARAQDYHFAQYDVNQLFLNPALIGDRSNDGYTGIRLTSLYRDQKSAFTSGAASYRSYVQGLDFNVSERFSMGAFFSNTRSVNNINSVTHFNYGSSYRIVGGNGAQNKGHQLLVGAQLGLLNKSFNASSFTYDVQYDPNAAGGFNTAVSNGENIQSAISLQFSANMGLAYKASLLQDKLRFQAGASIYNITKSTERYNGVFLPVPLHYNAHMSARYDLNNRFTLAPQLLFMYQNAAHELNLGSLFYYHLNDKNQLIFGLNWRQKNAIIGQLGIQTGSIQLRASYCFVNSYFVNYTNRGLEFSLVYTSAKKSYSGKSNN
jgi:type IX secretion system PorP/SprF family membrane protein